MTTDASAAAAGGEGQQGTGDMSDADAQSALADAADSLEGLSPEEVIAKLTAERDKWKGLSRKHESRATAGKAAQDELKKLQDAQLTEAQRSEQGKAEAEARAIAAETALLQISIAREYGLDDELMELLGAGTEDELIERAEKLARRTRTGAASAGGQGPGNGAAMQDLISQGNMPSANAPANGGRAGRVFSGRGRPVESLRPGALPAGAKTQPASKNDLFRSMFDKEQ